MEVALGFDTSCYTTSVAAVDTGGRVVASERMLLPVQSGQRGLRQSEAVFTHVRQLPQVIKKLSDHTGGAVIRAVAASNAPRQEEGSYMPVFLAGAGQAEALAAVLNVPCYFVSHQQGHIAAGELEGSPMAERFVALHLSGGTTELLKSENGSLTHLGGSLDLNAGQLVDRVGVALGLSFPAGPELEKFALAWREPTQALLPASMEQGGLACHLSGAETQCGRWITQSAYPPEQIAAEVFDLLARTVAKMLAAACRQADVWQALVVGGVASSLLLRELAENRLAKLAPQVALRFGKPQYSGDNAAGVALLGMRRFLAEHTP